MGMKDEDQIGDDLPLGEFQKAYAAPSINYKTHWEELEALTKCREAMFDQYNDTRCIAFKQAYECIIRCRLLMQVR